MVAIFDVAIKPFLDDYGFCLCRKLVYSYKCEFVWQMIHFNRSITYFNLQPRLRYNVALN